MTYRPPLFHVIYPPRHGAQPDYYVNNLPLFHPNPSRPFSQSDWPGPQRPGKVLASDAPANRLPLTTIVVVTPPFYQSDWYQLSTLRRPVVDTSSAGPSPLYTPNPAQPFHQNLWEGAARPWPKAIGEAVATNNPLLTPNPSRPFSQTIWDPPVLARAKAIGEAYGILSPLITPNPARPFQQGEWPSAKSVQRGAKIDDVQLQLAIALTFYPSIVTGDSTVSPRWMVPSDFFVNLLPLHSITVVAAPFSQSDWPAAATRKPTAQDFVANLLPLHNASIIIPPFVASDWPSVALPKRPVFAESFTQSLPIYHPNPTHPFAQFDWTSPTPRPAQSDRSFAEAISYIPVPVSLQPPLRTLVGTGI